MKPPGNLTVTGLSITINVSFLLISALIMKPPGNLTDTRAEYMDRIQKKYEVYEEHNARIGEGVNLKRRYTRLLIIKGHREEEEREHEIKSTGRRHLEIIAGRSPDETSIPSLFDADVDGIVPKTVILQGEAGIGKSMTSQKIMLDWASEGLYQDKFNIVFYLSCRELNTITGDVTLAGLLSDICDLQCERSQLTAIFRQEDNVLFIIDGFDELKPLLNISEVCRDPFQKTTVGILLKSLLGKKLLWKSSLIITTRPFSLESLRKVVTRPRYVAILGFTAEDRVEYFHHSFKSKEEADLALHTVRDNDILFTMCAVPILCWLVCSLLKQQMRKGLDVSSCITTTSIYLLYLESLLLYHCSIHGKAALVWIKKLCALANEGVWLQKIFFDEGDLKRHGLSISEIKSVFLAENFFLKGAEKKSFYSFPHLSVQEFFAALYYVLVGESERCAPAGEESLSPEVSRVTHLLNSYNDYLELTKRFLCGLSGEGQIQELERCLHCKISFREKPAVEEWLRGHDDLHNNKIMCLYEAQDVEMVRRVMAEIKSITITIYSSDLWFRAVSYCVINSEHQHRISIYGCDIRAESLSILSAALHKCPEIWFSDCRFGDKEETTNNISCLCDSLKSHPGLQVLWLVSCGLTSSCCDDLSSVISTHRSLKILDLALNYELNYEILHQKVRERDASLPELSLITERDFADCW